jgi:hypothetical protein
LFRILALCAVCFVGQLALENTALGNSMESPLALDPNAPSLPPNATDRDKFVFVMQSLIWARDKGDLERAPADGVGSQMLESLIVLDSIKDSPDDVTMRKQEDERANLVWNALKTGMEKLSLKDMKSDVLKGILKETIVGDGNAPTRDGLRGRVAEQLFGKNSNADDVFRTMGEEINKYVERHGPVITSVTGPPDNVKLMWLVRQAEVIRQHRQSVQQNPVSSPSKNDPASGVSPTQPKKSQLPPMYSLDPPGRRLPSTVNGPGGIDFGNAHYATPKGISPPDMNVDSAPNSVLIKREETQLPPRGDGPVEVQPRR